MYFSSFSLLYDLIINIVKIRIKKRRNALALAPFHTPAGFNPFNPIGRIIFLKLMNILTVINLRWHTFIMPFYHR